MYYNNKGSILIFTLIIFSIISTITMMCIGLNYSNKTIYNLEFKETKLIESSLSGIEICGSNIKSEINQIINSTNNELEFTNYLLSNNFINNIKDISKADLNNVYIDIPNKPTVDEKGNLNFKITSISTEDRYKKQFQAYVKIKNPFLNEVDTININDNEENQINDKIDITNENIDVNELVIMYDYKEI